MSFAQDAKNHLCSLNIRSACCKKSMLYGMLTFSGVFSESRIKLITENEKTAGIFTGLLKSQTGIEPNIYVSEKKLRGEDLQSYKLTVAARNQTKEIYEYFGISGDRIERDVFCCGNCAGAYVRGAFLSGGTVSDPEKSYHLDIRSPSQSIANDLCAILSENGIQAKVVERLGHMTVYLKDSESIQDFLTFIGAQKSALDIITNKIMKEVRNNENRKINFETANLYKTTGSAGEQIRAIEQLMDEGRFLLLPDDIQTTALIRLENPYSSLTELAALHEPPISKSGLNHRLMKIIEFSRDIKK